MLRKKLSIFALAALAAALAAPAQAQEVTFGVKGGVSISDLSIEQAGVDVDTDTRTGFVGGAFLSIGGRVFALQPEVLYAQKGAKDPENGFETTLELDYVEIPVLLVLRVPEGVVRPLLYAGPAVSFEARCRLKGTANGVEETVDCDEPVFDGELSRKKTDFGIVFGGGLQLALGENAFLSGEGRYNVGLVDIDDEPGNGSTKNRALSIMGGLGFRIR